MRRTIGLAVLVLLSAVSLIAQETSHSSLGGPNPPTTAPGRPAGPREFGVGVQNAYTISATTLVPVVSDTTYSFFSGLSRYRTGGSPWFHGGVTLPTGALITSMEINACDTSATATVDAYLYRCHTSEGGCDTIASVSTGTAATPGCNFFIDSLFTETVDQLSYNYIVEVFLGATNSSTRIQSLRVFWRRQMSLAPLVATFADVPTSDPFFRAIEGFAASGITSGCGGGNFCPDGAVTRKEVAKFFARALGLFYSDAFLF